jgi:hypothetical protein
MRGLSLIALLLAGYIVLAATFSSDSPHGKDFSLSCDQCHTSDGWKLVKDPLFDHSGTSFPLSGQHAVVACRQCHATLVFSDAGTSCIGCHTDMHEQTVGPDCGRCHTPASWIVDNITEIHRRSRFPLTGPHYTSDCAACHTSVSMLRFDPLGTLCSDCHMDEYNATTSPDHKAGGYSTNCNECHLMNSFTWTGAGINHSFFPLTLGHEIGDCNRCHPNGNFTNTPNSCVACHQGDFNSTSNPNHTQAGISTNCTECHTTNPGWKPAEFGAHDGKYFPIYSGNHQGTWNGCQECHTNPADYRTFSCIDCHEHNRADMDDEHNGVGGYTYTSIACYECHPDGSKTGSFNHNTSGFPLTGAHTSASCSECHTSGFSGTPVECAACHMPAFNQSVNPNHTSLALPNTCETCHSTDPGWKPASFPIHNNYYQLLGAHAAVANDCGKCHNGNYQNTPSTCDGCHLPKYTQTTNPSHTAAQFPVTCQVCHSQTAWTPATFNHDGPYFPIYSGKHNGEWNTCADCHTNPSNYQVFSCIDCHEHNQPDMDDEHNGVQGYVYNSLACFNCHPRGEAAKMLNRNTNRLED